MMIVHAGSEELILEADPSQLPALQEGLEKYRISEKTEFNLLTDRYRILGLHGPAVPDLLQRLWPGIGWPSGSLTWLSGPGTLRIVRWDLFHLPGAHLWVDPTQEPSVRQQLLKEGSSIGLKAVSPEAFDLLRIEAGIPWPGMDIDETVVFNELGREDWVSYTKGCFVGQEIVARIKYRAHPPRVFKGFLLQGTEVPPRRSPILVDLQEVGIVTSACFSPTLNRPIALGFLKYGVTTAELKIKTSTGSLPATVTDLPFIGSG
jgi:aminomethyltransferase